MRAVVVGGGIAGLAAALRLAEGGVTIILVESTDRLGGKLRTVGGWEAGAENFLMRDAGGGPSAAADLAGQLGLEIVYPAGFPAALYLGGELRPLPKGTLLGIPGPDADLTGIASIAPNDVDNGRPVLDSGTDVSVGELVRARLGDQIVSTLVDPLLGGVYAGRADRLSLEATMPGLHRLLQTENTLFQAVAKAITAGRAHQGGPTFGTIPGGLSRLATEAAQRLTHLGGEIALGRTIRDLSEVDADGVVLAVPDSKARRILSRQAHSRGGRETGLGGRREAGLGGGREAGPDGASEAGPGGGREVGGAGRGGRWSNDGEVGAWGRLGSADVAAGLGSGSGGLEYASVGLVTLEYPAFDVPRLSGFLIPQDQGLSIKAATFFTSKWEHLRGDKVLIRASLGRAGSVEILQRPDSELIRIAAADLAKVIGTPAHGRARVDRWGGGLPQYAPGHVTRVRLAREALEDTNVVLAGAAYDGIGIPACITSGRNAAEELMRKWGT